MYTVLREACPFFVSNCDMTSVDLMTDRTMLKDLICWQVYIFQSNMSGA